MPIHQQNGGWQWGNSGKVYKGKDAKKKAIRQALAAKYNGYKGETFGAVDKRKKA